MQVSVVMVWVEKAFTFLVEKFLYGKFPGMKNVFARLDDVLEVATEVVSAAEASGADGATKKAQATKALSAKLKALNIDLPGDQDEAICGLIVEALVGGLKKYFRLS